MVISHIVDLSLNWLSPDIWDPFSSFDRRQLIIESFFLQLVHKCQLLQRGAEHPLMPLKWLHISLKSFKWPFLNGLDWKFFTSLWLDRKQRSKVLLHWSHELSVKLKKNITKQCIVFHWPIFVSHWPIYLFVNVTQMRSSL